MGRGVLCRFAARNKSSDDTRYLKVHETCFSLMEILIKSGVRFWQLIVSWPLNLKVIPQYCIAHPYCA